MKLNKKGYMLIEIILASVIAFGVGYFILQMVINLKNKNDDLLVETLTVTDKTIILNKLIDYIKNQETNFSCNDENGENRLTVSGNTIKIDDKIIDIVNDYATVGEVQCHSSDDYLMIKIPIEVRQLSDKNFDVEFNYYPSNGITTVPEEPTTEPEPSTSTTPSETGVYTITFSCDDNGYWNGAPGSNVIQVGYDENFNIVSHLCVSRESGRSQYGWRIGGVDFYRGSYVKYADLVNNGYVSASDIENKRATFVVAWRYG